MKKVITILISIVMVFGLAACGKKTELTAREEISAENDTVVKDSISGSENAIKDTDETLTTSEADAAAGAADTAEGENGAEVQDNIDTQGTNVLVAYFSATNTTEGVAEHIANGLNADLYEITPEEPYTDADLNYNDNNSRTTIEMNDPDARPAISGFVENMERYEIVFIGYPIWWAEAPRIVSTFVESYDFSGKTIVPFCTSGGSGIGSSAANLEQLTSGAQWLSGRRLNGGDSQDTVMEWVNSLGLNFGE